MINQIIKNQIALERFSEGKKNKIVNLLLKAQQEIIGQLAAIDPMAPALTEWRKKRLTELNNRISDILDNAYKDIMKEQDLKSFAETYFEGFPKLLNKAIGVNLFDVTITEELLNSVVDNTMIDGHIIKDWWTKQSEETKSRLEGLFNKASQEVQVGIIKGEAIGELIGRIRGTQLVPGIMSFTKREAASLVRTSYMQVAQSVRLEIYEQNKELLKGYVVIATLDTRTTPLCRGLDGKEYDLNFQPIGHNLRYPVGGPPFHWNCRSSLIPITKSYDELLSTKGIPKRKKKMLRAVDEGTRASLNGQVPASLSYTEWLKSQPEETQIDVLGPARYEMWKKGKITTMSDLLHQNGRALTIAELKDRF